jgi:translation initiation factor IF-3
LAIRRRPQKRGRFVRINERIRAPQIRLIGEDGEQIGIVPTREALRTALEREYDLVEVAPEATPPVCRIMDYGKYRYLQSKKAKASKKKQHTIQVKTIRFRPKTEEHDYVFKTKHIREFLEQGNKVKVSVDFRGRELAHRELGEKIIEKVKADLGDIGVPENQHKMEGRSMTMILIPKGSAAPKSQGRT